MFSFADSRPSADQLQFIEGFGKTLHLITEVAAWWEEIAIALHFKPQAIQLIKQSEQRPLQCCRTMLFQWLESKGRQPVTWRTLIAALEESEQLGVLETISTIIPR